MLFAELRARDAWGAFAEFVTVREAKLPMVGENGEEIPPLIPPKFADSFPDLCSPGCGSEWIISTNRKKIMCCNPRCIIKMGHQLYEVFYRSGIKGVGPELAKDLVNYAQEFMEHTSHLECLHMPERHITSNYGSIKMIHYINAVKFLRSQILTFPKMVGKLAIPELGKGTADKAFNKVINCSHLVQLIEDFGGVKFFLASRGIEDPKVSFYLDEYLYDIARAEFLVFTNLRKPGRINLSVCITGKLYVSGVFVTKSDFVDLCNELATTKQGLQVLELELNEAIQSTSYLITSSDAATNKYLKAREREDYEGVKIIYSPEDFITLIKTTMLGLEEEETA